MIFRKSIALVISLIITSSAFSQSTTYTFSEEPLKDVLLQLERSYEVKIYFIEDWLENIKISGNFEGATFQGLLEKILSGTSLSFHIYREKHVVLIQSNDKGRIVSPILTSTSEGDELSTLVIGDPRGPGSNTQGTISGYIREGATGEVIIGAAVYIEELKTGATTNAFGFYSLTVPTGQYTAKVSYLGWQDEYYRLVVNGNGTFEVELFEGLVQLEGVTIADVAEDYNISNVQMGVTKLNISSIRSLPAFFGESDVIKTIQLLPGVTTVGEGAQGFNVRGGSVGDNLILLEGAPIFNSSHLFGFFSLFNGDLIKDVSLFKGGVPAQYGGRSSSVLDIKLKDGNLKDWVGSGGVGFATTRFALEGPLQKDKTALILGGRVAYPDWILNMTRSVELRRSSAFFYDVNGKLTHRVNNKNKISLMGYNSLDRFKFQADTLFRYRNSLGSVNWEHIFNDRLFSNFSIVISDYDYEVEGLQEQFRFLMDYGAKYYGGMFDLTYYLNNDHKIDFGGSAGRYDIRRGRLRTLELAPLIEDVDLDDEQSLELAAYVSDEVTLSDRLSALLGIRYSHYRQLGPAEVFQYDSESPRSLGSIVDTLNFNSGDLVQSYQGFEPRVSLRYVIQRQNSLKVSYNRLRQYVHLISNSSAVTPFDIWKSSDPFLPPQVSDQVAIGYFQNFRSNELESSVELFYRWLDDVPQFINGAEPLLNQTIETDIVVGEGRAYGTEFMLRKNYGRLTGWASYTVSRSERKAAGGFPEERINDGTYYPADFDHTHDVTLTANYKISRRWKLSGNFSYNTGRPITVPTAVFRVGDISQAQFSDRNQYRIPDFHRLDVALTFDSGHRRNLNWEGSWTLTLFNVYGRKNAFSVFFGRESSSARLQSLKLSVLGSVFPSLTYNFSFK